MATLLAIYRGSECVGRCDAKCYDAQHGTCDCVCGGRNHGAGQQQAIDNTREMAEQWVEEYVKAKGIKNGKGKLTKEVLQLDLF